VAFVGETNGVHTIFWDRLQASSVYYISAGGEIHQFTDERIVGHELGHAFGVSPPDSATYNSYTIQNFNYAMMSVLNENYYMHGLGDYVDRRSYTGAVDLDDMITEGFGPSVDLIPNGRAETIVVDQRNYQEIDVTFLRNPALLLGLGGQILLRLEAGMTLSIRARARTPLLAWVEMTT
jgi:hypothetical protein